MPRAIIVFGVFIGAVLMGSVVFANNVLAQDVKTWVIETADGNQYAGTIVEQNDEQVRLQTEALGIITIPRSTIKKMYEIDSSRVRNGKVWTSNPYTTRYFFGPSGFTLKKGEGYYQNVWIFFNNINYGVSDNFSLGAGLIPGFFFEAENTPVWITGRLGIPMGNKNSKVRLGVGTNLYTIAGEADGSIGLLYGALSYGSRDSNFTISVGTGYWEDGFIDGGYASFSGLVRVSRRTYLMTELYSIFADSDFGVGFALFGAKIVGRRMAVDLGLMAPPEAEILIPLVGISLGIGK